jgi:DEAD/DEAH box helicase domain-containing protein
MSKAFIPPSVPAVAPSTDATKRGAVAHTLARLVERAGRDQAITAVHHLPAREARFGAWPDALAPQLVEALSRRGITQLYTHQAAAIANALAGHHNVVVTPTASGKTICYNLPVLQSWLERPQSRALYLFPTKALSQDQLVELQNLADCLDLGPGGERLRAFTYDGDTADDARRAIRAQAHVVVTNPDMLHSGILPYHARWERLFENLKYVIIDEVHTYRGVFGSHLCNLIRRLKRIAAFYGSKPVFLMSSATIANPGEFASRLIEEQVTLINDNGAPQAAKAFVFYNPPVINADLGIRRSCVNQARWIASRFLKAGIQTITFATSRLNVEVLTRYLKEDLEKTPEQRGTVRGYRGGYLPSTRREIERGLRNGEILGVVSTNALELGIDIGHLDVAVLAGYPGSVASTWQQAGRAGRRSGQSVAVLVARSDPMDQFMITHPDYFLEQAPEQALINPDNLAILVNHVKCAAYELPFETGETLGRAEVGEVLAYLAEEQLVRQQGNAWHWADQVVPADTVSLRSISTENFVIMDSTQRERVIAEVDYRSAPSTVHEGAIYMCETQPYNVTYLDYERRRAYVKQVEVDYYTEAITNTAVKILDTFESAAVPLGRRSHGEVHVTWRVSGFKKLKFHTRETVGYGEVNLPDQEMHTTSYWLTLEHKLIESLPFTRSEVLDGINGLAYLLHHVAPLHLMCDVTDLERCVGDLNARWYVRPGADPRGRYALQMPEGGPPMPFEPGVREASDQAQANSLLLESLETFEPTIFLYDNYPGGIGFSAPLYDAHSTLLEAVRDIVQACPCSAGCPSCVGPVHEVGVRSKEVAQALLASYAQVEDL